MDVEIKCKKGYCLYNDNGNCLNSNIAEEYKDSVYVELDEFAIDYCNEYELG